MQTNKFKQAVGIRSLILYSGNVCTSVETVYTQHYSMGRTYTMVVLL